MNKALKYIVDNAGHKSTVLVPIEQWKELNDKYTKLVNKVKVLTSIEKGLAEVKSARANGKKLQTLKEFLRENKR